LRSFVHQLLMNRTILLEARALLAWARGRGAPSLAITGYSMGGYMAAYAGALLDFPVAIAACAAGLSPVPIYTQGQLARSIEWSAMESDDPSARGTVASVLSTLADMVPDAANGRTAVIVGVAKDGFVPAAEVHALAEKWPGAQVEWMRGGHVSAYVLGGRRFRGAVRSAVRRISEN